MSVSTSLITFRVQAPPSTRSVVLYGSWDNFKLPYSMQRDKRMGPDQWYGCHNFSNIICDGNLSSPSTVRDGGLKMGGTYWYYYAMDHEIEFHDPTQPSTTGCPLMPGQLVNVLQMPFALSGNRSRNLSTSSSSSDLHTMNPEDKFIHPRPAPDRPQLQRLNTSPTATETSMPDLTPNSSTYSSPQTAFPTRDNAAMKFFKLAKKPSTEAFTSPSSFKGANIRDAFRMRPSRSHSLNNQREADKLMPAGDAPSLRSRSNERESRRDDASERSSDSRPSRGLPLRSRSDQNVPQLRSFSRHRGERSRSREQSSLRSSTLNDDLNVAVTRPGTFDKNQALDSLQEVATPGLSTMVEKAPQTPEESTPLDLQKRLPTLPNTPSSAYPASIHSPERNNNGHEVNNLASHFSATTIDSDTMSRVHSIINLESSRFSDCTASTELISSTSTVFEDDPSSPSMNMHIPMSASMYYNFDGPLDTSLNTPAEMVNFGGTQMTSLTRARLIPERKDSLPVRIDSLPKASISTGVTTPSTIDVEVDYDADSEPEDHFFREHKLDSGTDGLGTQHYSLPLDQYSSMATLKQPDYSRQDAAHSDSVQSIPPLDEVYGSRSRALPSDALAHSEEMQKLLNELSYLSEMIRN